jgi:hypothetical protein
MSTVASQAFQVATPNLELNMRFAELPSDDVIAKTAQALTAIGYFGQRKFRFLTAPLSRAVQTV